MKNTEFVWESVIYGREEAERRRKIRKRRTYKLWMELWDSIHRNSMEEIMWKFYNLLDRYRAYRSERNAQYFEESLKLFLEDVSVGEDEK